MNVNNLRFLLTLLLLFCLFGCEEVDEKPQKPYQGPTIPAPAGSYLALGDSYTIGESVAEDQRWPVQLVDALTQDSSIRIESPLIIARTGWTTNELAAAIEERKPANNYEIVSLLIGVNNQYRGYPFSQYETEFVDLLDTAIAKAGGRADKVFVVSIPDYGVTPFAEAQNLNAAKIAEELDAYNEYAREVCMKEGVTFFDITPISRKALNDPTLVANDGLHPSGKMYGQWVELMKDSVKQIVVKK